MKAMMFDEELLFIGSYNLDPRSANINTGAGLYVDSPELAAQHLAYMDERVKQDNNYRLMLDEDGGLVWITENDGARSAMTRTRCQPLLSDSCPDLTGSGRLSRICRAMIREP